MIRVLYFFVVLWFGQAHVANAADCATESAAEKKKYTTTEVNIRSYPSTGGDVLATLAKGQIVYAFGIKGSWSRVNVASLNVVGYVASQFLTSECVDGEEITRKDLSRANVIAVLLANSQSRYSGSCPCPYYVDRGGRRCGARSAYSRPGGASPLCYPRDVTNDLIEQFKTSR